MPVDSIPYVGISVFLPLGFFFFWKPRSILCAFSGSPQQCCTLAAHSGDQINNNMPLLQFPSLSLSPCFWQSHLNKFPSLHLCLRSCLGGPQLRRSVGQLALRGHPCRLLEGGAWTHLGLHSVPVPRAWPTSILGKKGGRESGKGRERERNGREGTEGGKGIEGRTGRS